MSGSGYVPSLKAFRLYEKTSKAGAFYLVGRWGNLRITILPNRNKTEATDNNHDFDALLSEAGPYVPRPAANGQTNGQPHLPLPIKPQPGQEPPPWDDAPNVRQFPAGQSSKPVPDGGPKKKAAGGARVQMPRSQDVPF